MQKQCPYCTNMMDANAEYCPHCRAKNIKEYSMEEYSYNVKSHTHSGDSICDEDDNHTYRNSFLSLRPAADQHKDGAEDSALVGKSSVTLIGLIVRLTIFMALFSILYRFVPAIAFEFVARVSSETVLLLLLHLSPVHFSVIATLLVEVLILLLIKLFKACVTRRKDSKI